MGFRFSLDAVLRLRESIEAREELALQKIQSEAERVRLQIQGIEAKSVRCHHDLQSQLTAPSPVAGIQIIYSEIHSLDQERKRLFAVLDELKQRQQSQMQTYSAARRARQMLTDMRAEARRNYEQQQAKSLQKFLDDAYTSQSHRKS